jgi:molecular chaperone GrpE
MNANTNANAAADQSASETSQNHAQENADSAAISNNASLNTEAADSVAAAAMPSAETKLAEAIALAEKHKDEWLRAKAETDNIRRRSAEDVLKAQKFGVEKMADSLLAVKDSLDAALLVESPSLESFKEGIDITARQLTSVFERFSIAEINPAGAKFDPTKHQAIAALESEQEPNTVLNVMQKGYTLHDRVLRPALVTVSKAKPAAG